MLIKKFIHRLLKIEGIYSDDPEDSGGKTKYGITEKLARKYKWYGNMPNMPYSKAEEIYIKEFWELTGYNAFEDVGCEDIAWKMFEMSVNIGPGRASVYLQKILNAFNRREKLYKDLRVDGDVGKRTIAALRDYLEVREEVVIVNALACLQGEYYIFISQKYPKNEKYVYGWVKERISVCGHG